MILLPKMIFSHYRKQIHNDRDNKSRLSKKNLQINDFFLVPYPFLKGIQPRLFSILYDFVNENEIFSYNYR